MTGCAVVTLLPVYYLAGGGSCATGVEAEMTVTKQWHKVAGIDGLSLLHREGERRAPLVLVRENIERTRERRKKQGAGAIGMV